MIRQPNRKTGNAGKPRKTAFPLLFSRPLSRFRAGPAEFNLEPARELRYEFGGKESRWRCAY